MEVKPEDAAAAPVVEQITIKLRNSDGNELSFKVKKTTKFEKIMDAYSKKTGRAINAIRFHFDGRRVNGTDTPESLEMDDNDFVDVTVEQLGGGL